ncbi:sensor domain-containing diguanylate cyclase [Halomonas sp. YLGW01]|uniref:sensor domain-containing diguanylate cyclase n=1 Tax=Halomonas sp. YLGW01 TaxID=2773308 RepID=UPI001784C6C6|nr:sensor domain-containing diguanylate cyclase [Halomonas sp. YLGW01]
MTERDDLKAWGERLGERRNDTEQVIEAAPLGIAMIDRNGYYERVNPALCALYGYRREELEGSHLTRLCEPADHARIIAQHRALFESDDPLQLSDERRIIHQSGARLTVLVNAVRLESENGRPYKVSFVLDITERKRMEEELEAMNGRLTYLATHDDLSGLYNRRAGLDRLGQECHRSDRYGTPLSLAILDLDHFKAVNDRYGHATGDQVLREVSASFAEWLRDSDIPVRLGGEEFLLIMPGIDPHGARHAVERLQERLAQRLLTPKRLSITFSAGLAAYRAQPQQALMEEADRALFVAKSAGRNRVETA